RERRQPVTVDGGPFEIERFGRLLHGGGNVRLHLLASTREEILRLRNQLGVVGGGNLAGTWRRATLDLVKQAGTGAALERGVGAGAQQKSPLQRIDGAANGPGRSKRAEIIAFSRTRAAMLENAGGRMVAGQHDI